MESQKINVVIPAYNADGTIFATLASIAMQTIVKDVKVTIVDDASECDYKPIVARFDGLLDIEVLHLDTNQGPGFARQYGRENTSYPLITFIDADDTFHGAYALEILRRELLADPKSHTCIGAFREDQNGRFVVHPQDTVWVFGKMYRRAFLDQFRIQMNSTRSNEDTGFNALIKLCSGPNAQIKFLDEIVYDWHARPDSITRINDCDYSFNASFDGYSDNMAWAIKEARERFPFKEDINYFAVEHLCQHYFYLMESMARKPEYTEKNTRACVRYYLACYKPIEDRVTPEILAANYNLAARNFYMAGRNNGFIPAMSIQQFIAMLHERTSMEAAPAKERKKANG